MTNSYSCYVNPGMRSQLHCNLMLRGEALFWTAQEDGLTYAIKSAETQVRSSELLAPNITVNNRVNDLNNKVLDPDFKWNWGYRLGIGYIFPHDQWDIDLDWTHFYTKTSSNVSTNRNTFPPLENPPEDF